MKRGENYDKKNDNFLDYCDMNMRYLRISGIFQRKGRGIMIVPAKHILAEKLAKSTAGDEPIMSSYKKLCMGAPVRRHVSDAVLKYDKPVYGMFIAIKIDTNTAETFRHGIWYTRDDVKRSVIL